MSEDKRDILVVDNQQCPVCAKNEATFFILDEENG